MAARKSINLLPGVFQSAANEKFLSATVDQLISDPALKNLYGYIGRKFAPTYANGDSYITEDSIDRQNYQLEPSTIIKNDQGETTFFASYIDFIDKIKYYGGLVNDHSRLFASEYYSFDPKISFDKFVNFGQYYWLPNGPTVVQVNTSGVELVKTFEVTRNDNTNSYDFSIDTKKNNTLILARGGAYTFTVDQSSEFWIQTELGVDGKLNATPTISSRDILGVENNGATIGNIVFNVPQKNAQDRFLAMSLIASVDYAVPLAFTNLHNRLLSDFIADYPQYAGITGSLDNKTIIFVDQDQLTNYGEEAWTVAGEIDSVSITYDNGEVVAEEDRYGVWKIQLITVGDDYLINAYPLSSVNVDEKVYIRYGINNANKEYYKEYDGFFHTAPLITATANTLYIQDGSRPDIYTTIKIVDFNNFVIDVENDILGQTTYTSPNGVEFTSGLKIQFDVSVTPATYQNKEYYVENVGDSIRLVDTTLLVIPETYNDEIAINYPIQQIVLDTTTTAIIPAGTSITIGTISIDTNTEISAGSTKITTLDSIDSISKGKSVSGVGIASGTTVYDIFAETVFPDYITIKRDSLDLNAWARNNRWFHVDIIKASSKYNDEILVLDQRLRAQRPIVQFEGDLQLFNYGRIGKTPIDILDTTTTDAFNQLEGQVLTIAFGVTLFDGMRIVFAADIDPLVKDKIYVLNLVQFEIDAFGKPSGNIHIKLTQAADGGLEIYDTVVVKSGVYKGSQWWYDGVNWNESQQKTALQQDPLFDVYDNNGISLSDVNSYPRSTFAGTKVFGYQRNTTGTNDTVLGFPLTYRSFQSQGDILFANYFNTDTFEYIRGQLIAVKNISIGFLQSIVDRTTTANKNTWRTVSEPSRQYQLITFEYDGTNSPFALDVTPNAQNSHGTTNTIPYVKVYLNQVTLTQDKWTLSADNKLTLNTTLTVGDTINVEVYSATASTSGYYQIPLNLDLNAQNVDITTMTVGQIRNHVVALSRNSTTLVGDVLGDCNLRDIEIKAQGGSILQHSAPLPYAELFLLDDQANFVESVQYAQREYSKFKNKFFELSVSLPGIDPTDPITSVDLILKQINSNKMSSSPWFYSDMIPYGTLKNTITYTVFDPFVMSYELTNVFSSTTLSNQAVLVYLNNVQLILGLDYTFDTERPAITFNDNAITFAIDDIITIVEYANTDGCYVPETPTKIGAYPKFNPELVSDDTYRTPINVIRGHDGSITPAFDDYRDNFLLELEKRIYNNIKLPDSGAYQDIFSVIPGKFRSTGYSYTEVWNILSRGFLTWVGNNKVDFTANSTFQSNDEFTWNYSKFVDRLDNEYMQGSWRAVYQYFYDTIYPHTRPWEMLGFSSRPDWWESYYGPGPYTGGNKLLWDDLEAGLIRYGDRALQDVGLGAGIDPNYARPGLSRVIPVDDNGYLLSPAAVVAKATNGKNAATSWAVGQLGPVEWAWRSSSDFPFAVQQAVALAKPAVYFGQFIDTYKIQYNYELQQYLTLDNRHVRQTDITFNGDTSTGVVNRGAGYLNWIADYLRNLGIDPSTKITPMLKNYQVNLAYKMAGFSDKKYLQVLAEQSSPTSTNASIMIPNENYDVLLFKSTPVDKITYSAVIVEKTTNGYSIRGYNLNSPYFTIIPSVVNNNAYKITVLGNSGVIFKDYQNTKVTVPYGYEFKTQQQVVDFLISYERYLLAQGFTFNDRDGDLGETRNWKLSVKEFLFWAQQGWKSGSLLVMSPVTNSISAVTVRNIVDGISDSQYGSKIVDQNFNLIKNTDYKILRTPSAFNVTLTNKDGVLALVELNLVQYEHVLSFNNTTVFNDVIYKPELGNRQYRLKLIGQKTDNWDGSLSAPGFIYNSKTVQSWQAGKDYLKGELVLFKNQYYVALTNAAAEVDFNFSNWKQLSSTEIQTGLLSNFSTIAVSSQSFYDSYGDVRDNKQLAYSHGLIGFKPRQYLEDLGLSETTQIEFYKGYIKQKGSTNAIDALTKAEFNNLSSAISFYEEWAVRTGEYGALNSNPYVEIPLDERAFSVNPAIAEFVSEADNNRGDGLTVFNKSQLYKSTDTFNGNIALLRNTHSNYDNDILTAGYVNIDDVSTTIYDLANYADLDNRLADIGTGYTIWCAKDFSGNWNVYRVSETDNYVAILTNALDGYITWTTNSPHGLLENDIFLIRGFNANFDGFYQVYNILDLKRVTVKYVGNATNLINLNTLTGYGVLLVLDSLRFTYMEDSRVFGLTNPKHGWRVGEKIWIDDDAATSTSNGQTYNTVAGWKVYEKTKPWNYDQTITKSSSEYQANDGFGTSVKLSYDGLLATVGSPYANSVPYYSTGAEEITGRVNTFDKNYAGKFVNGYSLVPDGGNVIITNREFGYVVDQAIETVAVGSPGSYANIGFVYVYDKIQGTTSYTRPQIIWSGNLSATGDRFGSSIAFDENGTWLYVGAPGNDRVYVYGLNTHVTEQTQVVSINDRNTIRLNANISLANGAIISDPSTGATATVLSYTGNSIVGSEFASNLIVTTLTGFTSGNSSANIYIDNVDSGLYANILYHVSTTSTITTNFTPMVDSADSLLVTNSKRTFIPNLDYTLSGSVITFKENITQDTYVIKQQSYYTLQTILQGTIGSNFGYAMDSSLDGAQLAVGAPNANVFVGNTWIQGAGAVYVYDRVIEAFDSTGSTDYTTNGNIDLTHRVTIDNVTVENYTVPGGPGSNLIRFVTAPPIGKVVYVETNQFNLLEILTGVDSLIGGTGAIQTNAAFGTSLTICSNNCAIYIGAPNYNDGITHNAGAVWKFHNRGRLYGTNNGYTVNPIFAPGDTIRLDNFEVTVQGQLMPTTNGNILALNSGITAYTGDHITQTGSTANLTVVANVVNSPTVTVTGNWSNLHYGLGNIVAVNGANVAAYPMASLDGLVKDINDANLLGITASNENNTLRLNSNKTVAKNLLRILSGSNTVGSAGVYAAADMRIFAFMQIIVNPYHAPGEYFGNKVVLAQNASMLVIGSARGTTKAYATFDTADTIFDQTSTSFFDGVSNSGSVYIYELYDDPRNHVENPGRYSFAQQLNTNNLNIGDGFGTAVDVIGSAIIVSAPSDDTTVTDAGSIYIFSNPKLTRGWNLIRYQQDKVDVESVNRLYLYNKLTNTILTNLEFIDPAKGKILGQADQEITYKTEYDPAVYNRGANANTNFYWGSTQVNQVWWNLGQVRFIDYEQGSTTYRSINWGRLFPGSVIEVCEWVESTVLPSQYVVAGYDGIPKYANNSQYVEIVRVDPTTNIIGSLYYFWVTNKTSLDATDPTRSLPIQTVADYIANPKSQNIAYAAITQTNAVIVYNASKYLSAADTILHLDYDLLKNDNIIHSEYELIQKSNPVSLVPDKISTKLIDSLAGLDELGRTVPDPKLSLADRYGVSLRPRQSMFIDRLRAMSDLISYVNDILITKPIARQYDLTQLLAGEAQPNFKLGEYDLVIATEEDLSYINTSLLTTGYKILVENNTTQDNLWILYELQTDNTWKIARVQSYKTDLYWDYVDWYADGYNSSEVIEYVVDTLPDALKLPVAPGDEVLVKVNTSSGGGWNLLTVLNDKTFAVVGIENGTIQLNNALGNFADNNIGLGNQGFDSSRFDQSPNIEIRNIINALKDDIFINELQGKFNDLFFVMINYLFTEQKYVDWIFKTSFVSITHYLRELIQPANYIKDNITYYENYINEVKPYITKIREYLTNYNSNDLFNGSITDFDLAPYYDPDTKIFRSPDGTFVEKDRQLWATGYLTSTNQLINQDYPQWYRHRNFYVDEIIITNTGSGYTSEPTITISGGGANANVQATAIATINGDTGTVTSITVVTSGVGYYQTPTVTINGSLISNVTLIGTAVSGNVFTVSTVNGLLIGMTANTAFAADSHVTAIDTGNLKITMSTNNVSAFIGRTISFGGRPASAYAVLRNDQLRTFDTTLKFDRISYGTTVEQWSANTFFLANTIVSHGGQGYQVRANITTGSTFITSDYTLYSANNFSNANDRIMAYYAPLDTMPAKDLNQLIYGIEYPGVQVQGLDFNQQPGISGATTAIITLNTSSNVSIGVGNVIVQGSGSLYITTVHSSTQYEGDLQSPGFTTTGGNISIIESSHGTWVGNLLTTSARPASITYNYNGGTPFGTGVFDNVDYDEDGNPIISENSVDTIIRSEYLDTTLGLRPEDIDVDGGAYADTYSSHAPEELVPGIVYDTLDMKIYTKINSNVNVIGYRIFDNMSDDVSYLRIADAYTTTLTSNLKLGDTTIGVTDATKLPTPNLDNNIPGVVFIGTERITYWTANVATNTLGQIRRGTQGTAAANLYLTTTSVIDGSIYQLVPGTEHGNVVLTVNTNYVTNDSGTNVTIGTGNVLITATSWYNLGTGHATDSTGFTGATTSAVNFLKAATVTSP